MMKDIYSFIIFLIAIIVIGIITSLADLDKKIYLVYQKHVDKPSHRVNYKIPNSDTSGSFVILEIEKSNTRRELKLDTGTTLIEALAILGDRETYNNLTKEIIRNIITNRFKISM